MQGVSLESDGTTHHQADQHSCSSLTSTGFMTSTAIHGCLFAVGAIGEASVAVISTGRQQPVELRVA